jgi:hypothetical protein
MFQKENTMNFKNIFLTLFLMIVPILNNVAGSYDLKSDKFDMLESLGKEYLFKLHNSNKITITATFSLSIKTNHNKISPKVGFIGFEYKHDNIPKVIKLRLKKNENGWAVKDQLPINKLNIAHRLPLPSTGHKRTDSSIEASLSAGIHFEKFSIKNNFIEKVRSNSVRCYVNKDASRASCSVNYGLKKSTDINCLAKHYLLHKESNGWFVVKTINSDQEVDYSTGALKKSKERKKAYCSYISIKAPSL